MTYYLLEYSVDGEAWLQGSPRRYSSKLFALINERAQELKAQGFQIRAFEVQS